MAQLAFDLTAPMRRGFWERSLGNLSQAENASLFFLVRSRLGNLRSIDGWFVGVSTLFAGKGGNILSWAKGIQEGTFFMSDQFVPADLALKGGQVL